MMNKTSMRALLIRRASALLLVIAGAPAAHAQFGIPGITPPPCPPNTSCVPGIPPILPPTLPGTCGPGPGGATCGGSGPASPGGTTGINVGAGNPINIITGNKYQREVDMPALPGELGLEIVRHYNSAFSGAGASTNLLGRGWKLSYETELTAVGSALQIVQADGTRTIFNRDPANPSLCASANPADGTVTIVKSARGEEYLWRWSNGRELSFDAKGKLVQILAPTGHFVSLQHDARGLLVSVTDPQGRRLRLNYLDKETAKAGAVFRGVQSIVSPVGTFSYVYGSTLPKGATINPSQLLANLVKVSLPGTARYYHYENPQFPTLLTGISALAGKAPGKWQRVATYGYDNNGKGNLTVKGEPARLARTADGKLVQPAVLAAGTGVEQVTLDTSVGGRTTIRNSLGQQTVFLHTILRGQFRLLESRGAGCATCGETNVRYGYDQLGRLTTTTRLSSQGVPAETVLTEYDGAGRIAKVSKIAYLNGKPGPAKWQLRHEYTGNAGQPTMTARPSVSAGKEMQTRISYHANGQVLEVAETGWAPDIDKSGQAASVMRTTAYRYATINGRSLLTAIEGPFANGKRATQADVGVTRIEYDKRGNYITAIHTAGNVKTNIAQRDEAGRPLGVTLDEGARVLQTQSAFTPQGQLLAMTQTAWLQSPATGGQPAQRDDSSKLERKLDAQYDSMGRLTALRLPTFTRDIAALADTGAGEPSAAAAGAHANLEQQLRRGEAGSTAERDVLEIFRLGQAGGAEARPVARRWLDDFGRLIAIQYQGQGVTRASYAAFGPTERIERIVDPMGIVTDLVYNAQGQVATLSRTGADGKLAERLQFKYAGSWLIEQSKFTADNANAPESRISTRHNAFGQIVEEVTHSGPHAHAVNHEYDSAGRTTRTWVTQGAGERNLPSIRMHYQGDASLGDQIASIEAGDGWFGKRLVIDALQWLKSPARGPESDVGTAPVLTAWRYGNGLQARSQFDSVQAAGGAASVRLRDYHDGAHPFTVTSNVAGQISGLKQGALQRKVAQGKEWHLFAQAHAAASPALPVVTTVPSSKSWPASQAATPAAPAGATDAAGRLLEHHGAKGSFALAWDSAGNLGAVKLGAAEVARYRYDAQGRRIAKDVTGHPERDRRFLYSGKQLIAEADRDGHIVRQYVYLGWRPVAWVEPARSFIGKIKEMLSGPTLVYLHTDPRGAVTAGTDASQTMLWDAEVDPNGNVAHARNAVNTIEQPLRLVNQYADAETGLSYNLARYYDPRSGNFLSPDPAGLGSGSLDLYAYAAGDPLNYVDPDGWATIQYFAIDSGAKVGANLQPDAGRWAFIITGIAGHLDRTFVYDRSGSYLGAGKHYELLTQAAGAPSAATSFGTHYAGKNGFYSPTAFTREMSDANATGLIESLTGVKLGTAPCPANLNSILPAIPMGVQGTLKPTLASAEDPNRLISCPAGTSASDILLQRIQKSVEIHEVKSPGSPATDKDCATAAFLGCAAGTWNPALKPGTNDTQPASYGWTQFTPLALVDALNGVSAADLTVLGITAAQRVDLQKKVAGVQKWYDKLVGNGSPTAATVSAGWATNQASFIADTGLAQRDYDRMVSFGQIGATLTAVNATYKAAPHSCTASPCFWDKWQANNPTAKAALLLKASTELGATQVRLNPYIRNLALMGEGRAGFQFSAIISSPIGQSLLTALSEKSKSDILAKSFLGQKMKQARQQLNLVGNNNLSAAQELSLATRILKLQNGSDTYPPKVLPHFETTFCTEGTATSTNGYLRMEQLKVIK